MRASARRGGAGARLGSKRQNALLASPLAALVVADWAEIPRARRLR